MLDMTSTGSDLARENASLAQSLKLSHDLGSLTLSHGTGQQVHADLASDITTGGIGIQSNLGLDLNGDPGTTFNVTLSRDLADALGKLSAAGAVQIGIDDTSAEGIYGSLAAQRSVGKGLLLDYSSTGRLKDMEHSLKLSNDLGYAQVVKAGDAAPRLRLGYEFEA